MKARFTPALFAHAEAVLEPVAALRLPGRCRGLPLFSRSSRTRPRRPRLRRRNRVCRAAPRPQPGSALRRQLSDRRLLLAALAVTRGWTQRELAPVLKASEEEWLAAAKSMSDADFPPAVRCDLPDWLYNALEAQFGAEEVIKLAQGAESAGAARFARQYREDQSRCGARPACRRGHRRHPRPAVADRRSPARQTGTGQAPAFPEGAFEVQDEGSQLLGYLLDPKRGEMVVDFCAGAGGKTLLLGALMKNTGRLYAYDVSDKRLARLKPRLARSGLSNVHPARIEHERDTKIKRLAGKARPRAGRCAVFRSRHAAP
jgi:16S rRNA (cytosine967-C5)-methyltransferase